MSGRPPCLGLSLCRLRWACVAMVFGKWKQNQRRGRQFMTKILIMTRVLQGTCISALLPPHAASAVVYDAFLDMPFVFYKSAMIPTG